MVFAVAGLAAADDRQWENPVFHSTADAVAAARTLAPTIDGSSSHAERFFVDLTLAGGDLDQRHPSADITRTELDDLLVTHPTVFGRDDAQRRTIERFLDAELGTPPPEA